MADPESSSSGESVICNDDLLIQIFVRLPLLSLVSFKFVSKRWLSLIKHAISLIKDNNLTFRRNLDPPYGLFLEKVTLPSSDNEGLFSCDFVSLDNRIPLLATNNVTFGTDLGGDFTILQSCNGLLLCSTNSMKIYPDKFYVYNPSVTDMFKVLPLPADNVLDYYNSYMGGLRMAFDPAKSPHYKVIYAQIAGVHPDDSWFQMHTYSSKTGNWSICGHRFPQRCFVLFRIGVYWNEAIYWINNGEVHPDDIFKLDIKNEHPVLTASRIPFTLCSDVRYECRLFESRGCLLLVGVGGDHFRHVTIYEKGNVYSEWSLKFIVNLDCIINQFPKRLSGYAYVFCVVLGEREEDSFLVTELDKKVIQYKIVSKTLSIISNLGPNDVLLGFSQFIPSFANV